MLVVEADLDLLPADPGIADMVGWLALRLYLVPHSVVAVPVAHKRCSVWCLLLRS